MDLMDNFVATKLAQRLLWYFLSCHSFPDWPEN